MSFSSDTKTELCQAPPGRLCCAQAEAYGVLLYCNKFDAQEVRVVTECGAFARRLPGLFQTAFQVAFDRMPEGEGKCIFSLHTPEKLQAISAVLGYDPGESVAHHINFGILEEEHCRTAFFRGAFLAGGSVTDPAKRYHLELATPHYSVSRELLTLLLEAGFTPKETTRKANYMAYFKQSGAIAHFLTAIGAPRAAETLRSAKAEKDLLGSINRKVNCDAANLDKTVEAAQEQIEAIQLLEAQGLLLSLPDKLKEAVDLRVAHPELTLAQLAELCDPPVSKSALNHRLRKLVELAGKART
ncbi:MAG: DNA-binding protein WhiA [Oscillospiraceae bacterium]|nr:DNA-binding protein WhiA [Oscillospiraceae bacterium]